MGVYRSTPAKEKEFEIGASANGKIRFAAAEMQGWRITMEDAHISRVDIAEDTHLFGVFDGHGGREVAKFVQRHFVEELLKNPKFKAKQYESALQDNFLHMDEMMRTAEGKRELQEYSKNEGDEGQDFESMAGCTGNVVLIIKDVIYCANAGDSRSVLCDAGKAVELSEDHKPDNPDENKRITTAGGYVSDGRINGNLNLSRAIGDFEYKKNTSLDEKKQLVIAWPDVRQVKLNPSAEFLLMGCDGIWESMTNEEIIELTRGLLKSHGEDPKKAVEELLEKLIAPDTSTGIGCDNMTSIIIKLK
eukprot:TRINITY_DN342_c0_g2_i1.p1 TRINITY_DN342_c0_g2~~TRINITY_DN342_c0_g2_i1.p1  ORF type:complete len:304 (-),score=102.59 TRINITY_DN342_c0_g2_i1:987-1898(-)